MKTLRPGEGVGGGLGTSLSRTVCFPPRSGIYAALHMATQLLSHLVFTVNLQRGTSDIPRWR